MNFSSGNQRYERGNIHHQPQNAVLDDLRRLFGEQKNTFGDIDPQRLVDLARKFNENKNYEFKSTQFRKFYDAVRGVWDHPRVKELKDNDKLGEDFRARLIFLRPHIIKASKEEKLGEFGQIMDFCLQKIATKKDLYKFVKFFESIIAYAK